MYLQFFLDFKQIYHKHILENLKINLHLNLYWFTIAACDPRISCLNKCLIYLITIYGLAVYPLTSKAQLVKNKAFENRKFCISKSFSSLAMMSFTRFKRIFAEIKRLTTQFHRFIHKMQNAGLISIRCNDSQVSRARKSSRIVLTKGEIFPPFKKSLRNYLNA